jgi:hypothetical protein
VGSDLHGSDSPASLSGAAQPHRPPIGQVGRLRDRRDPTTAGSGHSEHPGLGTHSDAGSLAGAGDEAGHTVGVLPGKEGTGRVGQVVRIIRRARLDPVVALPPRLRSLAGTLGGRHPVEVRSGPASAAALALARKPAMTIGSVIHLARPPDSSPASAAVVAHELVHVAHARRAAVADRRRPRFFDDTMVDGEERVARHAGSLVRQMIATDAMPGAHLPTTRWMGGPAATMGPTPGTAREGSRPAGSVSDTTPRRQEEVFPRSVAAGVDAGRSGAAGARARGPAAPGAGADQAVQSLIDRMARSVTGKSAGRSDPGGSGSAGSWSADVGGRGGVPDAGQGAPRIARSRAGELRVSPPRAQIMRWFGTSGAPTRRFDTLGDGLLGSGSGARGPGSAPRGPGAEGGSAPGAGARHPGADGGSSRVALGTGAAMMPVPLATGPVYHPVTRRASNVEPIPPVIEGSSAPAAAEFVDWIVEQVERRVLDDLERRGRRHIPDVF